MSRGIYGLARQTTTVASGDTHIRAAIRRDWRRVREKWDGLSDNQRKAITYGAAAVGITALVVYVVRK